MPLRHVHVAVVALAAAAVLVGGCSSGDGSGHEGAEQTLPPTTSTATATTAAGGVAVTPGEPTCEDGGLGDRGYVLCTVGDQPDQPLVVALHGRGSSAEDMRTTTGLDRVAAASGVAVVFPDGLDARWGDDTFPTPTRPAGDEDVVFLDDLLADLRTDERIAAGPVGVVGFSNGASMTLRYAAQRPDEVRAAVAVAGQLPRDPAIRPAAPVPLLEVYGTADPVRSHTGGVPEAPGRQAGRPTPTLPTEESVAAFVTALGEAAMSGPTETDPVPDDGTHLRTRRWTAADSTGVVVLHEVVEGGHTWPSAPGGADPTFGTVSRDIDASAAAIAFVLDPTA